MRQVRFFREAQLIQIRALLDRGLAEMVFPDSPICVHGPSRAQPEPGDRPAGIGRGSQFS
jgi:hypothetical protein